jgi:hypothetical protein
VSTPRDYGNVSRGQQPGNPASGRMPASGSGQPQQGGTPWYQQPPVRGYQAPPSWPTPAGPQQWQQPAPAPAPPSPTPKSGRSGLKVFLTVSAVLLVLAGLGVAAVLLLPGIFMHETKKIPIAGVQTQVQKVLLDRITGYNDGDISNVKCNNGQDLTVKKGDTFTCDVTVRGKQHQLTVKFPDDTGTYEVGIPQLNGGK